MWGHKKVLNEMKWLSVDEYRNIAIQKFTHKVINTKEPEYLYTKMTQNRSPRILQENKVTSYHPRFGFKLPSRRSIRYESIKLYNNLPSKLTLLEKPSRFKSWIKRYYRNKYDLPKS